MVAATKCDGNMLQQPKVSQDMLQRPQRHVCAESLLTSQGVAEASLGLLYLHVMSMF